MLLPASLPDPLAMALDKSDDDKLSASEIKDGFRVITANNIPSLLVGKYPNPRNPNIISPQKVELKLRAIFQTRKTPKLP